jgi:hypothetical protein
MSSRARFGRLLDTSRVILRAPGAASLPDSPAQIALRALAGGRATYVITSAQNGTNVHKNGLQSLLTYCLKNRAQLLVIPYRYKNPTSQWSKANREDDSWNPAILPYLVTKRTDLNNHLTLLADIMTQPTATRPLEGFETLSGSKSAIIGHPKLELKTVATPQEKLPKVLTTTGSITEKNYITSKAGKKGEHHHTFGATIVEVENEDRFHIRQINMKDDGSFCDLLDEYDGGDVRHYDRVPALVMGDTHVNVIDGQVVAATFRGPTSIVGTLKPKVLVWHDVHDGTAKNHHDRGRMFHEFVKHTSKQDDVGEEVKRTVGFIDRMTPPNTKNIIVPSNHNDFLREWVENVDPRRDPENIMFWAETVRAICASENTRWTENGVAVQDVFTYWAEKLLSPNVKKRTTFLRRDQASQIEGIEVGYHGDKGPGGARGSRLAFSKIGVKSIIGHAHAPGITDGCYQAGTNSRLGLTYASGSPSGWLHTDCVIYPNGKRSLINIIDGKWRVSA